MRRVRWVVRASSIIVVVAGLVLFRPDRALHTASGMTAHNLCAAAFIQGVSPEATFQELIKPMAGVAAPLLRYQVDRTSHTVRASVLGLFPAQAVYTSGYGCRLIYAGSKPSPQPAAAPAPSPPEGFAPPTLVAPTSPAMASVLDQVFAEYPQGPRKRIKAVVIVKDGKVVAERYAPGFGVDTPLLSYSVAKSFTNALLAVLVGQGRLGVGQPVYAPEWRAPGDPRSRITVDDLLRMQSGLNADETGSGFDPASQMLYVEDDMAVFAAHHPLRRPPGTEWRYTSANTLILDRALGQVVGGGAAAMRRFAQEQLFQPLHMDGVTMEFDGAGTFSGSAHVYAPARAFARFGLLYLNDGIGPDGTRILPPGWTAYSRRSTLGSTYGAGFWTNEGPSPQAAWRVAHGFPKDGFFASGNRGQRIYIVPSQRLVVARFGYTEGENFDIQGDVRLIAAAIAALKGR